MKNFDFCAVLWVCKMSHQLVINWRFLWCQLARTIIPVWKAVCTHLPPRCDFRPVLPLHRNDPIDLLSKWFLDNDNIANLRHQLFHISFSTFLEIFFTPFPKCSNWASLFLKNITARIQTEKPPNNSYKQFYANSETRQIKIYISPNYRSRYFLNH